MMRAPILFLFLIASCSAASVDDPLPMPVPPVPPLETITEASAAVPAKVRAELKRVVPRENALAASPESDGEDIATVRHLHQNVVRALDDLERDGGRQMTPKKINAAQAAMRQLQRYLDKFAADHKI